MKELVLFFTGILILISVSINQTSGSNTSDELTNYYYYNGEKYYLEPSYEHIFIEISESASLNDISGLYSEFSGVLDFSQFDADESEHIIPLQSQYDAGSIKELAKNIQLNDAVVNVSPVFKMPEGKGNSNTLIGIKKEIIVQFIPTGRESDISNLILDYDLQIIQSLELSGGKSYVLKVPQNIDVLKLSNDLYLNELTNFSEPNFYFTNLLQGFFAPDDPHYPMQWSHRNTGNNIPQNISGTPGSDMRTDSAWAISKGSPSVLVSIVDSGIDTLHEDLSANFVNNISIDTRNNLPYAWDDHRHGTAVAGIVAAVGNNSIGISGTSPEARIFGVKISNSSGSFTSTSIINGLIAAWQRGSWVSNNSWGGGAPIAAADNAIMDGVTFGRNGLGVIWVFSTGNNNSSFISWPSSNPNVISVGAMSPCNQRKSTNSCDNENTWGSNYGVGLDVVAPGVKIYTTDRSGAPGYTTGDYTMNFNGTSSAAPNVSGVCALMLAVDPTMRWDTVRARINRTADEVGAYTYDAPGYLNIGGWNSEMGHGKINANSVVKLTQNMKDTNNVFIDCMISSLNISNNMQLDRHGTDLVAEVFNGSNVTLFNIPVYYKVNNGTPAGPITIPGPLPAGQSTTVTFSGALSSPSDVTVTVSVYTALNNDVIPTNDTIKAVVHLQTPVTNFPYLQNFTNSVFISGNIIWNTLTIGVDPGGNSPNTAAVANFYSGNTIDVTGSYRSPIFNLTGMNSPVLSFFVAYKASSWNDRLRIGVSTNGGKTFSFGSPEHYTKSFNSVPSLATTTQGPFVYYPTNANQWRHEMVDLSEFANNTNVIVALYGTSAGGNYCFVDNFRIFDADNTSFIQVNSPGVYGSLIDEKLQVEFTSLRGQNSSQRIEVSPDASQGVLSIAKIDDFPSNNNYAVNNSATTFSGAIFTPDVVSNRFWEVAFSGDDYQSSAIYNITVDISSQAGIVDADRLYIMKRINDGSPWVCHSTITEYDGGLPVRLTASGLQGFSQFAIGAEDGTLPVDLISFSADVIKNDVILYWTTAWEENNMRFDIQRRPVILPAPLGSTSKESHIIIEGSVTWQTTGSVTGSGSTQEEKSYSFSDKNLVTGKYEYRLVQVDFDGNSTADHTLGSQVEVGVPMIFDLAQNYPNPFNPITKIGFEIPVEGLVKLIVYDISGREVATLVNEVKTPGYYLTEFNGSNLSSGVYFYRLVTNNNVITKKLLLMK